MKVKRSFLPDSIFRRKLTITVFIVLLFGVTLSGASCAEKNRVQKNQIVTVTDIHFNPFYDPSIVDQLANKPYQQWDNVFAKSNIKKPSLYNEETNPVLFKMLLTAMRKKGRDSSAIIFTGDILAHNFNEMINRFIGETSVYERNKFIDKTISYVSMKIDKALPGIPVYFSLGNNDAYSGDYALVDDGEFLHTTADLFFTNFLKQQQQPRSEFFNTYPAHGYFSLPFPAVQQGRIIGLNTIFFSTNYKIPAMNDPGKTELDWLEKELIKAEQAGEKVWILMHIPPGVNVYSTERNSTNEAINVSLQWKAGYNQRYLELVRKYNEIIAASFAGHTHMDDFRLIYDTDEPDRKAIDFIHISASVTPVFGNNPSFQIISYNPQSGTLNDTVTCYINLKDTMSAFNQEYVYSTTYSTKPDLTGLAALYPTLVKDQVRRESYTGFYPVSSKASSISNAWQWYWCGIGNLTPADYTKAYKELQQ